MRFSDNLIVMQFTGLLDKNGKEIYEGDIIECTALCITDSVWWNNELCRFSVSHYDLEDRSEYLEVVGNIYENKELLQEVK